MDREELETKVLSFADAFNKKREHQQNLESMEKILNQEQDEASKNPSEDILDEKVQAEFKRRTLQMQIFREISNQMLYMEAEISVLRARQYLHMSFLIGMFVVVLFLVGYIAAVS